MSYLYVGSGCLLAGIVIDHLFVGRLITDFEASLLKLEQRLKNYIDTKIK